MNAVKGDIIIAIMLLDVKTTTLRVMMARMASHASIFTSNGKGCWGEAQF